MTKYIAKYEHAISCFLIGTVNSAITNNLELF